MLHYRVHIYYYAGSADEERNTSSMAEIFVDANNVHDAIRIAREQWKAQPERFNDDIELTLLQL